MVYLDDDGYRIPERKVETVQCRLCGSINRTINEVVAQHYVENGCPSCQVAAKNRFISLMERAGLGDDRIAYIFEHGLD